jgi:Ca2+-binding EF-hand superfamily protein
MEVNRRPHCYYANALVPVNQEIETQLAPFMTPQKERELLQSYKVIDYKDEHKVNQCEAVTILKSVGVNRSNEQLKPFFEMYCCIPDEVKPIELIEIMNKVTHEERLANSLRRGMEKVDNQGSGLISSQDALNLVVTMTDPTEVELIKSKKKLLEEMSKIPYKDLDLCVLVRQF